MLFGRKTKKEKVDTEPSQELEEAKTQVDVAEEEAPSDSPREEESRQEESRSGAASAETPEEKEDVSAAGPDGKKEPQKTTSQEALQNLKEQGEKAAGKKSSETVALQLEAAGLLKKTGQPLGSRDEAGSTIGPQIEEMPEGYTTEEDMLKVLSDQIGMPYVEVNDYLPIEPELLHTVPGSVAQMYRVFPLEEKSDGALMVAMVDPLNVHTLDDLGLLLNRTIRGAVANEGDILDLISEYYGASDESVDEMLESLQEEETDFSIDEDNFDDLERIANEAPIIKLVNLILLQAIKDRASDLHVEPYQNSFRIRYRVDGTLHETVPPPKHLQLAIISRLKVMANMNIAERRLPQDGRIKLSMSDREIDLRVSSLPTVNGECIVMRILDKTMMMIGLEQIGFMPEDLEIFEKMIRKPHGIVLVTGPTGSGKTTTLYAALMKIYSPMLKMITTENPVEYQLDGVVQVNINERVGLTFPACLRSILRQDPDIIMVGEIRDLDTAQISIESALTGHLVLSTLHTNDAPGAVTRLVDMGTEPFLITSTVEGVLAQRLVRTICTGCKEPEDVSEEMLMELGMTKEDAKDVTFYRGRGCPDCNYSGYRGRIGIYEILSISEATKKLILDRAPTSAIRRQARREGMRSMREDGWEKIVRGITTVEEIIRETQ